MKNSKKVLAILITFVLCTALAACGSPAGNTGGNAAQAEPAAEESSDEETEEAAPEKEEEEAENTTSEPASEQTDDTVKKPNVGVIAWSLGLGDESEFVSTLQTVLSEQYSDQIGEVFVMDSLMDPVQLPYLLENMIVMWESEKVVILIVNDENGFSDEDLLAVLETTDKAGIIVGVDHAIDGAPESTFVYDASDPAGSAAMIAEIASK